VTVSPWTAARPVIVWPFFVVIVDQGPLRLAVGRVAQAHDQAGRAPVVAGLDGDCVLAVDQVALHVEALDPLPVVAAADRGAVDPD
jgi:hypothetical protein